MSEVGAVGSVARAEMFALVRRPAVWTIFAAVAALNQVFSYLVPYLSYRSGDAADSPRAMPPRRGARGHAAQPDSCRTRSAAFPSSPAR